MIPQLPPTQRSSLTLLLLHSHPEDLVTRVCTKLDMSGVPGARILRRGVNGYWQKLLS